MKRIPQNTPKETPIRKRLLLQEKGINSYYYKSPCTLTNEGTNNLPSLALESSENSSDLTFEGYLAGTTLVLFVR